MPYVNSNICYDLPSTLGIGDSITINGILWKVINFRIKGSFSGKGYYEFKLENDEEDIMFGYCDK